MEIKCFVCVKNIFNVEFEQFACEKVFSRPYSKSSLTLNVWKFNLSFSRVSLLFLNSWRASVIPYSVTTHPPAIRKQQWHWREAQIEPPLIECECECECEWAFGIRASVVEYCGKISFNEYTYLYRLTLIVSKYPCWYRQCLLMLWQWVLTSRISVHQILMHEVIEYEINFKVWKLWHFNTFN